jgi:hypothetical protein
MSVWGKTHQDASTLDNFGREQQSLAWVGAKTGLAVSQFESTHQNKLNMIVL